MNIDPQLQARYDGLVEEHKRRSDGFLGKLFAMFAAILSVLSIGMASEFDSAVFVVPAVILSVFFVVVLINSWGFKRNLQEVNATLSKRVNS
ncbi:MAG: hypothetical protein Q7K26_02215 [bacterium]|nr:hypothetical protein [bacterium]